MFALRRFVPRVGARQLRMYSAGDAGSAGSYRGQADADSFTRREQANEDFYVREHEKEQLRKLRAQIEEQQKSLDDLKEKASKLDN